MSLLVIFHRLTDLQNTIQSICVKEGPKFQAFHEMTGNFRHYAKCLITQIACNIYTGFMIYSLGVLTL